jgi:hypothetical protein
MSDDELRMLSLGVPVSAPTVVQAFFATLSPLIREPSNKLMQLA